ncbi:TetR/AcrR family transcriptional regulator [Nitrospinaceae bacterium]|nr:TetR/AcrR family transcriptional regulator [Nitrospinaceae bacterium]
MEVKASNTSQIETILPSTEISSPLTQFQKKRASQKKTLYYHFKSKEELILAALRYRDNRFRNDFMRVVAEKKKTPQTAY